MKTFPHFFVSVALFLGAIGVTMAQETAVSENTEKAVKEEIANTRRFEVGKFNDNWFIGIGGGVNQYLGEHDRQMKFAHRLAPAMDVYFGKWFTPCLGFRIAYSGGQVFGLTNQDWQNDPVNNFGIYSEAKNGATSVYWQEFHLWNLHVDFMLNLMNLIGGYKERAYSLSPYFGVGLARSYALKDIHNPVCNTRLSGNVGILNTFRLCDALDLNIDVRGTLFPEDFEGEYGVRPDAGETYESDGMLTATIGLAYKLSQEDGIRLRIRHFTRQRQLQLLTRTLSTRHSLATLSFRRLSKMLRLRLLLRWWSHSFLQSSMLDLLLTRVSFHVRLA